MCAAPCCAAPTGLKVMCEMSFWKWQLAERGEGGLSPAERLKWQVFTQRQHAQFVHVLEDIMPGPSYIDFSDFRTSSIFLRAKRNCIC